MMKLLVGVDGSDHAMRAVRYVGELGRRGLTLEAVLCHVRPPGATDGEAALASAQAALDGSGVKATPHHATGEPASELARVAEAWDCDAIVVGHRGLGRMAGALFGSVSSAVSRRAEVPVIVVP